MVYLKMAYETKTQCEMERTIETTLPDFSETIQTDTAGEEFSLQSLFKVIFVPKFALRASSNDVLKVRSKIFD
jgi:hypothetical protein